MFQFMVSFGIILLSAITSSAENRQAFVGNCQPCEVIIARNEKISIYYNLFIEDDEVGVSQICVKKNDNLVQVLNIEEMVPVLEEDDLFLGVADIDFDGFNDIYFVNSKGVVNSYANYWIYDKQKQAFTPTGVFPVLSINEEDKTLSSYENIGSGGREYVKRIYKFHLETINVVYEEKSVRDQKTGKFIIRKKGNLGNK